jgi:CxxC motif-containing protein (DUF1111 family)
MTRRRGRGGVCTFGMALAVGLAGAAFGQQPGKKPPPPPVDKATQLAEGQKLFLRDWLKEGKLNPTGDGLGPMYNAASCMACHKQQGIGGGGPDENNVDLLSIARHDFNRRGANRSKTIETARKLVHPGFAENVTSLVLHKNGPQTPFYNLKDKNFAALRDRIIGEKSYVYRGKKVTRKLLSRQRPQRRFGRVTIRFSQRNTPALFGAGLIDSIPDSVILDEAERQRAGKKRTGVSGRVPQTFTGAVGRFGWRGQTATLHDFVLGACANELGLEVPGNAQPRSPDERAANANGLAALPVADEKKFDLTEAQCRSITAFVANLPAPSRARKLPLETAKVVRNGEKLFAAVGCAVCHKPDLGSAKGLYSDMLLHDMGPRLYDPAPATPEITRETASIPSSGGYYGGNGIPAIAKITTNIELEWRTPPLWGVADSAPYLHDGRAKSLEQAILWHGGEATRSVKSYKHLKPKQRKELVAFLQSLVAPGSGTRPGATPAGGLGFGGGVFSVSAKSGGFGM